MEFYNNLLVVLQFYFKGDNTYYLLSTHRSVYIA